MPLDYVRVAGGGTRWPRAGHAADGRSLLPQPSFTTPPLPLDCVCRSQPLPAGNQLTRQAKHAALQDFKANQKNLADTGRGGQHEASTIPFKPATKKIPSLKNPAHAHTIFTLSLRLSAYFASKAHHPDGPHGFHSPRQAQQDHLVRRAACSAFARRLDVPLASGLRGARGKPPRHHLHDSPHLKEKSVCP